MKYERYNEAIKEYNRLDKFLTQDLSCLKRSLLCSSVKTTTFEWLKKLSHCPSFAIFDRPTIFLHMFRVSWNHLSKTHRKTG